MSTPSILSRIAPLESDINEIGERVRSSIVAVHDGRRGSGTGVVWSTGIVITNDHVARSEHPIVVFTDGNRTRARVIARDQHNDLAVLRINSSAAPPAVVGDSLTLKIGQIVAAIGHPIGVENALTVGILSGLPSASDRRLILRANLVLNPGNSGGPLLNARGEVVGINAMVAGPGEALAVPAYIVQAFLTGIAASVLGNRIAGL